MKNPSLIEIIKPVTGAREYKIPAGTSVSIRPLTDKEWNHNHKTTKDLVFSVAEVVPQLEDKMNIVFARRHGDSVWLLKINKIL